MFLSKENDINKKPKDNQTLKALAQFSQIGFTLAASIFVGVFLGKFLDDLLGTTPWLLFIFSLLGVGAAFKSIFNIKK